MKEKENEELEKQLFRTKEQILNLQTELESKDLNDIKETDSLKDIVKEYVEKLQLKDNELERLNLKLSSTEKEKSELENDLLQSQTKVSEFKNELERLNLKLSSTEKEK